MCDVHKINYDNNYEFVITYKMTTRVNSEKVVALRVEVGVEVGRDERTWEGPGG